MTINEIKLAVLHMSFVMNPDTNAMAGDIDVLDEMIKVSKIVGVGVPYLLNMIEEIDPCLASEISNFSDGFLS